ncbi:DUF6461 domain-containing protein [Streptomyces orinoci]|uniref:DUF6461 domain-containing protein n=1 Tax=Streptomyces orinoci TaxID=67339 RepID=A0ABV3K3H0_STRON|nr:DUF6461 domain-containing protein [Streptomyces orinoci]
MKCPLDWIADDYDVFCLTLAKGLSGRELLLRLSCEEADMFIPEDEESALQFVWEGMENYDTWGAARAGEVGEWAFSLELASTWGSISERLEAASTGTDVISCSAAGPLCYVEYWQNGTCVMRCDMSAPESRAEEGGIDPDRFVGEMQRVGFFAEHACSHRRLGLSLLHEITGVSLGEAQTMLGLTARIPAIHHGPEGLPRGTFGPVPEGAVTVSQVGARRGPRKLNIRPDTHAAIRSTTSPVPHPQARSRTAS